MTDKLWHKAAVVFIFGGPLWVFLAYLLGGAIGLRIVVGLWVGFLVGIWMAEGRELNQ